MVKELVEDAKRRMDKTMEVLQKELASIRTGRASLSILDHVRVDYYGNPMPLNQVANLAVDLFQRIFGGKLPFDNPVACHVDRIMMAAHLVNLFARAVLGGVRHRMSAVPVREHFEDVWPLTGSAPGSGLLPGRLHGTNIHTIHLIAGNIERQTAPREIDLG